MKFSSIQSVAEQIKNKCLFPWLYHESKEIEGIIISPDTDGFISALFLNEFFGWKVVGFYDGKNLVAEHNFDFKNKKQKYVFIDIEILRPNIKSIGHHILLYDAAEPHSLLRSIEDVCIQPNDWRGIDIKNTFAKKYPFGTFHLLISILYYLKPKSSAFHFDPKKAIVPSIFIDGVFKNLFNYPENCLDWLKYMTNNDANHPFEKLLNHPTTPKELMSLMKNFFGTLNSIWTTQEKRSRGKIKLDKNILNQRLKKDVIQEFFQYLNHLAQQYGYKFNQSLWPVITEKLISVKLEKGIASATKSKYVEVLNKNPISLAVTSKARDGLEYTKSHKIFLK